MMSRVKHGIIAGFIATVAVSIVELANIFFIKSFVPFPEVIAHLAGLNGNIAAGWGIHFVVGTLIMGPVFAYLYPRLPTATPITKGILFAVACWAILLFVITMDGDRRIFSQSEGFGVFAFMLASHMVFGVVMGNVFARLQTREKRAHSVIGGAPAH